MCKRRDVIFLYENDERTKLHEFTSDGPFIGIWWDDGVRIVAILERPTGEPGTLSLVDSDLLHVCEWPTIAHYFNESPDTEYYVVPRGRVLFDLDRQRGIIYHGNATTKARLRKIAARFGLVDWESRLDDHYLTGEAADDLFRDD